jgi:hypothetical protein
MDNLKLPSLDEVLSVIPLGINQSQAFNKRLMPANLSIYGSSEGFIGENENLRDILINDYRTLERLNLTYNQIADKLDELMKFSGVGKIGNYKFGGEIICGEQFCPWQDGASCNQYVFWLVPDNGKSGFEPDEVYNTKGTIEVSGLMPHLIRNHYFFEGQESRYRIDPEKIAKALVLIAKRNPQHLCCG